MTDQPDSNAPDAIIDRLQVGAAQIDAELDDVVEQLLDDELQLPSPATQHEPRRPAP